MGNVAINQVMDVLVMSNRLPDDWKPPFPLHTSPYMEKIKEIIENLPEFRMICMYIKTNYDSVHRLDMHVDLSNDYESGEVILIWKGKSMKMETTTRYPFKIKKRLFRSPKIIWDNMIDN